MKYIISFVFFSVLIAQSLDERYHSVEEIYGVLDSLDQIEEISDYFLLDTIGFSTQENIPILAVRISDNAHVKEDEPRVLFIGQVHAEEILGVEIVMDLIDDLLFPDPSILSHMNVLKQYLDIWLIPTANPEGLNVVHEELDFSFRKNKRDLSPEGPFPNNVFDYDPSIGNDIDGVDLNRNFSFNWALGDTFLEPDNSDYASHYDYYKGEEPFSESEARAIRDLAIENDFVFSIVWHSSRSGNLSEKVFTSWKWEEVKESPDLGIMKSIADHFAGNISTEDGTSTYLSVFSGSRNGKLHDWFYKETGCIQYLVECGTSNLQPDSTLIENTIDRNKPAMVYLMDRAIGYYADAAQITGRVFDATTNQPLENVIVEVEQHTGSILKPRLTNEFGRFRRILDVGSYNFSFRAEGYEQQNILLVANNSGITEQNIYLNPSISHQVNLRLSHDDFAVYTISGLISNEYGMTEIEISSGDNYFDLKEGTYQIEFVMDGSHVPWEKTVFINSDKELNVVYESSSPILVNNESILDNSVGPWCIENENMLKTQSNTYYSNGDAPQSVQWIESDLIDVSGTNRLVLAVSHRYETEWDYDSISISFLDINDSLLALKSWTGDNWNSIQQDFLTAETDSVFNYVKLLLEFSKDETVNYRGWEIEALELFPVYDNYLGIEENISKNMPKIPLKIHSLFPNPSYGKFQLGLSNFAGGKAVVTVFNLLGQNILTKSFSDLRPGSHQIRLDLNDLNGLPQGSGIYFIQLESLKEQAIKKCIILKN
ncbi:MAG: M14 family zinc carboxypeptidase [Candidatus Neomarinimicrobiota bacterium]